MLGGAVGNRTRLMACFPPFQPGEPAREHGAEISQAGDVCASLGVSRTLGPTGGLSEDIGLDPTARGGAGASAEALSPTDEALCHSSLGKPIHHVPLEFLGELACWRAIGAEESACQ